MKIWLIQANEPVPLIDENQRLFRTGMLAQQLYKQSHEIIWFATTFDHYTKKQRFNENKDVVVDEKYLLKLIYAPGYKKNISVQRIINHKYMAENFSKVINKLDKPDIIYCSFPTIELAQETIKYAQKNGIKVIIDIRDLWPDIFSQNLPLFLRPLIWPYKKLMDIKTKRIFKNAYCLNAISETALIWGLDKIGIEKRNRDYYYYIGYQQYSNSSNEYLKDYKKIIPFIGTIGNQIDYDLILEIARLLEKRDCNVEIAICGDGPSLEKFKLDSKGLSNLSFLGWIDSNQIRELLSKSFLGLIPYKNTFDFQMGVGNKFGEVLSFSLPVILTCEGVMESLVNSYDCGICERNAVDIVDYIERLVNDDDEYQKCKTRAKKLFEEKLNSEIIYKELVTYIENVEKGELI